MTFVEFDPLKIADIQAAILDVSRLQSEDIHVVFNPLTEEQLHELEHKGFEMQAESPQAPGLAAA